MSTHTDKHRKHSHACTHIDTPTELQYVLAPRNAYTQTGTLNSFSCWQIWKLSSTLCLKKKKYNECIHIRSSGYNRCAPSVFIKQVIVGPGAGRVKYVAVFISFSLIVIDSRVLTCSPWHSHCAYCRWVPTKRNNTTKNISFYEQWGAILVQSIQV